MYTYWYQVLWLHVAATATRGVGIMAAVSILFIAAEQPSFYFPFVRVIKINHVR
jgi:hypothetical protein